MDLRKIRKLIELVNESGISELDVKTGDEQIRIARAVPQPIPAHIRATPGRPAENPTPASPVTPGTIMAAPLSGTFYRAPAPGEPAFVNVGDQVAAGDVLCIIESMKMMNKIESEVAGEVAAILIDDGRPIESGTGLFRII